MSAVTKKRKIASATLNNIPDAVFKAHIMPMSSETESLRAELDKVKQQLKKEKASADFMRVEMMSCICSDRMGDYERCNKQAMIDHYYFEISCDGEVIHSFKAFKLKEWPTPNEADVLKIYLATPGCRRPCSPRAGQGLGFGSGGRTRGGTSWRPPTETPRP